MVKLTYNTDETKMKQQNTRDRGSWKLTDSTMTLCSSREVSDSISDKISAAIQIHVKHTTVFHCRYNIVCSRYTNFYCPTYGDKR